MNRCAALVIIGLFLTGCATVGDVDVQVQGTVDIDCGAEPVIDKLRLLPVEPIGWVDDDGEPWVVITVPHYENLSENMVRIESRFDQDATVVRHYRNCIENFNHADEDEAD